MNEINFNIEEIEKIDLSMDVGVKEIFPPIENLEVTPTKEQQVFNHENSYGYDKVTVEPIPDEYIIPDGTLPITENATYDVRSYARVSVSVYPAPNLQDKEVTPTKETQTITSDVGYNGLNQVVVFGDNNLLADNIKDGVEIFGVMGNVKASASSPKIGLVFEEWDDDGYPITATIYGFTSVPKNAFKNVTGYTGTAKLKKITLVDATEIGEDCFNGLAGLIDIILPDNLTAIGSRAFSGCTKLSSLKTLPSLEMVKDETFKSCGFVQLSLPECTKLSGASASYCGFRYCNNFKAIWVGNKITDSELKAQAFSDVPNLKYIFINLPREKVEKFQYYSTKWSNGNIASDCQVICNDDNNWKTLEEFDAIDWSTM